MDGMGLVVLWQVGSSIGQSRWPSYASRGWRHAVGSRLRTVMVAKPMPVLQGRRGRRDARQWWRAQMIGGGQRWHSAGGHLRMCAIHVVRLGRRRWRRSRMRTML